MADKLFGVDISLYQGKFDFAKAKSEGVTFVIIKASEGSFVDPEFADNYKRAKSAKMNVGAYHYLRATTEGVARAEAKFTVENCLKGRVFEYPIFVDVEDSAVGALPRETVTQLVKTFCDTLEDAGYWAGFYTNLDWYRNHLDGAGLAGRYSFWYAYWGTECTLSDAQMWQFGGNVNYLRTNKVAGVVCDQDYCFVDYPKMISAKGLNGLAGAKPQKPVNTGGAVLRVGDRVKLKPGAPVFGTDTEFAPWVYDATLYVREISGDRIVVSTLKSGAVTGAVDRKYLVKI